MQSYEPSQQPGDIRNQRKKSLDDEKHLTTTIAIWPAYVESRLVHEHDMFFLNSMRTVR